MRALLYFLRYVGLMMLKSLVAAVVFCACLVLCDDKKGRGEGVKYSIDDGIEMLDAETFQ